MEHVPATGNRFGPAVVGGEVSLEELRSGRVADLIRDVLLDSRRFDLLWTVVRTSAPLEQIDDCPATEGSRSLR